MDWSQVSSCFSGKRGDALVSAAQAEVVKKIGKGSFTLPTVQVDATTVCTGDDCTYAAIAKHLNKDNNLRNNDEDDDDDAGIRYFFASK